MAIHQMKLSMAIDNSIKFSFALYVRLVKSTHVFSLPKRNDSITKKLNMYEGDIAVLIFILTLRLAVLCR
jgi:hypothetical protein